MVNKWIFFVATFLLGLAIFTLTSEKEALWENIFKSLVPALVVVFLVNSKFFSRLIEKSVKRFVHKK